MCENLEQYLLFLRRLSYFSARLSRCVSWFLFPSGKSFILEKQDVWLSWENTSTQGLILHIPLALVLCRWGFIPYLWYKNGMPLYHPPLAELPARSHFLKFCQFWKLSKMQKNFPFFLLRLSGCLIKKRVSFLCSIKMKREKVDWKKKRFFINFLLPLQFCERSLKCLLILKVWNLAARYSWDVILPKECQTQG